MFSLCRRLHTIPRRPAPSTWVIYRDENVIVLNKPNHIAVHSGTRRRRDDTVDGALDTFKFGYNERPHLVHRLDEATSGALMLARTAVVAATLSRQIRRRQVAKDYIAVCNRIRSDVPTDGIIYSPLFNAVDRSANEKRRAYGHFVTSALDVSGMDIASAEADRVRSSGFECESAATRYSVLCTSPKGDISVVRCQLLTGRKHQIRVHMTVISDGIVQDSKHNAQSGVRQHRNGQSDLSLYLHAHSITFRLNGVVKRIVAPLPHHMTSIIKSACGSLSCIEDKT